MTEVLCPGQVSVIARPSLEGRSNPSPRAGSTLSVAERQYYVYILANATNVALYIGVTGDLKRRVYEHKQRLVAGFAEKYGINKLVYYEMFDDPENAILREK